MHITLPQIKVKNLRLTQKSYITTNKHVAFCGVGVTEFYGYINMYNIHCPSHKFCIFFNSTIITQIIN